MSRSKLGRVLVLSAALLSSACATKLYAPRDSSVSTDFDAASYRCVQESRVSYGAGGTGYIGLGMIVGSAIAAKVQSNRLFDLCMRAQGFVEVKK